MAMTGKQWLDLFLYGISWWILPLIFLFFYKKRLGKFPIGVTIYEKRGNDLTVTNDCCGRFNTPLNEYRFKASKDSIPIPEYDWVLQYMFKPTNIFEKLTNLLSGKIGHLTIFKYGSKQYKPIKVTMPDGTFKQVFKPIRNEKGQEIFIKIYEPIDVRKSMSKLEFEVIDWDDANHLTQELRAIATRRSPIGSFLEKYGGWLAIVAGALLLIIGGYYYKEMIMDAGNKASTLMCSANPSTPATPDANAPAGKPNIPVIGGLLTP